MGWFSDLAIDVADDLDAIEVDGVTPLIVYFATPRPCPGFPSYMVLC